MDIAGVHGRWCNDHSGKRCCAVCETELGGLAAGPEPLEGICSAFECRRLWQSKDTLEPFLFEQRLKFCRSLVQQRKRSMALLEDQREEQCEQKSRENKALEVAVLKADSSYANNSNALPTVVLESRKAVLGSVSQKRLTRYRQHLYTVISQAFGYSGSGSQPADHHSSDAAPSELAKLNGRFCAACQGGCCVNGGEKAYITADTIRRIRRLHPGIRPLELSTIFITAVATKTVSGSCINHSAKGCGLARDFRSDTCNAFYCEPLRAYGRKYRERPGGLAGALLISRKLDVNNQSLHPDGTTVSIVEPHLIRTITL